MQRSKDLRYRYLIGVAIKEIVEKEAKEREEKYINKNKRNK